MSTFIFTGSYEASELTGAVIKLPAMPLRLARLFRSRGVRTTKVHIDIKQGRLVLVENQDRRAAPKHMAGRGTKRGGIVLECAHLPLTDTVAPDDLQDVRAFGTTELISKDEVILDKLLDLKNSIEMTKEIHRLGAVKGVVYDVDGEVLHDFFEIFKIQKKVEQVPFSTTATKTNPILDTLIKAKRKAEQAMGARQIARFEALTGEDFFDKLTGHELIRKPFEDWQANQQNFGDNDYRKRGFTYAGITFIDSSESVNGKKLVDADKAHMFPVASDIFDMYHAPANWMETVNTVGLDYYARMDELDKSRGYDVEVQSNPLAICNTPEGLVELGVK